MDAKEGRKWGNDEKGGKLQTGHRPCYLSSDMGMLCHLSKMQLLIHTLRLSCSMQF